MEEYILLTREDPKKHPVLSILIDIFSPKYVINIKSEYRDLLKVFSFKGIVIVSDPLVAMFCLHKRFIFFSLEMFEHQVESSTIKNRLRNSLFSIAHRISLRRAKEVVFPNMVRAKFYAEKFNLPWKKIRIQPNYPSRSTLATLSDIKSNKNKLCLASLLESLGASEDIIEYINDKTIYAYIGSINSTNRGIKEITQSVKKEKSSLLLIAGKQRELIFDEMAIKDNAIYLGELEHFIALTLLNFVDYGFLYYSKELKNTNYCAPVKIFEYINMGVDIIGNDCKGLCEYSSVVKQTISESGELMNNLDYSADMLQEYVGKSYEDTFKVNDAPR
jgi:hypothetical protein